MAPGQRGYCVGQLHEREERGGEEGREEGYRGGGGEEEGEQMKEGRRGRQTLKYIKYYL